MKRTRLILAANDLGWLLICATRYDLGRTSYAPSYTSTLIQSHLSWLSDSDLGVLLRDILEYPRELCGDSKGPAHDRPEQILGDERYGRRCDQEDWQVAALAIVAEQKRRAEAA